MSERYISTVLSYRKAILVLSMLLLAMLAYGVLKLSFTSDFRAYFGPENPQLQAFEKMEATFSKQDTVYFLIRAKEGNLFTPKGLDLIWQLTEHGWELPFTHRVTSLQNYQHTDVQDDDLLIDYLYYEPENLVREDIKRIQNIVMNEPTLMNKLISRDGATTGVTVRMVLESGKTSEQARVAVDAARQLADSIRPNFPDFEIMLGGSLVSNVTMGEAIKQDVETLLGVSYLVMIIIMIILLRTFSGMLVTLLIISFSVISTMGLFGWLGYTMTPPSGFVPTAVMTIAVADTIHILVTYYYELTQGRDKIAALKEAMRINFSPIFITSITTMVGVLCLNTSDSPPYRDMGNMIAAGVIFAWLYSITFLPALLAIIPAPKNKIQAGQSSRMTGFANVIIRNYRLLFIAIGFGQPHGPCRADDAIGDIDPTAPDAEEQREKLYCNTQAFIDRMNEAQYCGFDDWRLPTITELINIQHMGLPEEDECEGISVNLSTARSLDRCFFPWTQDLDYWTSTTFARVPSNAWIVNHVYGVTGYQTKSGVALVRLVREDTQQ